MCGIAGSWRHGADVPAMLDAIAHRGPDGRGIVAEGDAVHGHVRLAIQDPTPSSAQPFRYRDGVLSYNGELWNAPWLRDELARLGHVFSTTGDTEVLAAALHEWGRAALDRLDGMFCFAWTSPYDAFVVRDRLGKLPLYLVDHGLGGLSWASERKAFGRSAAAARPVGAGTGVDLATGASWGWGGVVPSERPNPAAVEKQLIRGVEKRMVSDVPLCTLLSGGLDSSLVTAIAASIRPDIVAYTITAVDGSADVEAARDVAAHLGIEHRVVRCELPTVEEVRDAIRTVEIVSKTAVETTTICKRLAARLAADGFKVALSGETADELFGGYGTLCRKASSDDAWRYWRMRFLGAMAGKDYHRVNKSFMAHGVEVRMPFCERDLVENVLGMGLRDCPTGKKSLAKIAERWIPHHVAHRAKAVFHGPSGVKARCEEMFAPSPVVAYGKMAVEIFGAIPRG